MLWFTFIYVRWQTAHKHLAGEALDAFPVLVGVTVVGTEDSWDTLAAVAIVKKIVINRKEGGAAWWRGRAGEARRKCQANNTTQAETLTNTYPSH